MYFIYKDANMTLQDAIINRIEQLKQQNNMTQYALSGAGDITQTTLISIKYKHTRDTGVANVFRVCQAVGISLVEFFDNPLFDGVVLEEID